MYKFKVNLRAIAGVMGAVSKDQTRAYLCHPVISFREGEPMPRLVATDGHRCYTAETPVDEIKHMLTDLPLPLRLCHYILACPGGWDRQVELTYTGQAGPTGSITAKVEDMVFTLNGWPDWTYPDWRRILPNPEKFGPVTTVGLDGRYLADLNKAAAAFSGRGGSKSNALRLDFTDEKSPIMVTANTPDGPRWMGILMPMRV